MRRRLDLAAGLIIQPPLIFLDEPTTGLDPRNRNQLWETIRNLVAKGSTILLTTQYLDEADQLADRIAVIDHGRVIIEGTPNELKSAAGVTTLHLALAHAEDSEKAIRIVQSILKVKVVASTPTDLSAPMADPDPITDVLIALRSEGVRLNEVSVQKPSLDEVFMILTGNTRDKEEGEI